MKSTVTGWLLGGAPPRWDAGVRTLHRGLVVLVWLGVFSGTSVVGDGVGFLPRFDPDGLSVAIRVFADLILIYAICDILIAHIPIPPASAVITVPVRFCSCGI